MKTIFLVDDHAMVREGLRALLEAAGYEVIGECDNPVQAVREVLRLEPDLVLLDLSLGEANGLDVLSDLRRRGSQQRCIVLTMLAQPRQVAEALRLGQEPALTFAPAATPVDCGTLPGCRLVKRVFHVVVYADGYSYSYWECTYQCGN